MTRAAGALGRRWVADRGGGAAIDFGLTLPFLIVFLYGIVELSRMLWGLGVLNFAVQQAARCAVVNQAGDCSTTAATKTYAANWASLAVGLQPAASAFTVNTSATCGTGVSGAQVSVSVNFRTPVLLFLPNGHTFSVTLAAQSCYPT